MLHIAEFLKPLSPVLVEPPNILFMPTGDGMVVVFLHGGNADWIISPLLGLIHSLQDWARVERAAHDAGDLRMGVYTGAVESVTDINAMPNLCASGHPQHPLSESLTKTLPNT